MADIAAQPERVQGERAAMLRKLGIGLLIAVAAYAAWSWIYPTYTYRYRMTVEVEAGGKIHSGSSVIQVTYEVPPKWLLSANRIVPRVKGEAVFVDLGGGRNVIALLAGGENASNVDYPFYVVPNLFGLTFSDEDLPKYARLQDSREISAGNLPTFVTFSEPLDDQRHQAKNARNHRRTTRASKSISNSAEW